MALAACLPLMPMPPLKIGCSSCSRETKLFVSPGLFSRAGLKSCGGHGAVLQLVAEAVQGVVRAQEERAQLHLGQKAAQGAGGVGAGGVAHGARGGQHLVLFQGQGDHLVPSDEQGVAADFTDAGPG